ncbi:peptidoglycan DD-metalloendopeptidase family protein [uncultured Paraglaciecola sp.]|uniref:murein hydrolase activator EnvC family protein n=1 Tax=uncultured Paraglaciecola sp. TaxID=1765024 RepID=UPI00260F8AD6|nr:peptidoglycan DD-metalloendopeptidase family protein [uncultured Paraglaciecola sp.]
MISSTFLVCHAQEQSDLESIQQQIKSKQAQINLQLEEASKIQRKLRNIEILIADSAKSLKKTQQSLVNNQQQLSVLNKQKADYLVSLNQQKKVLAKQIRSAYITGNYDFAKMLLNQEDAAKFERTISYYQYLNKARKLQIDNFNVLVADLQLVNGKLQDNQNELQQLKSKQLKQQQDLKTNQTQREGALLAMQSAIATEEARVAQLQINERNLLEALKRAQQRVEKQDLSLSGLKSRKGKLLMPADGKLRKMFGRFRQGQIKWKGVVIYGSAGDSVVAIHHAKVLYSDWLRGFGLVTVLDHGDGFMSLYGHNQALLKQAGEVVQAGEAIALLGQSGGQSRPNLYFEIRHKGKPINPVSWLKL